MGRRGLWWRVRGRGSRALELRYTVAWRAVLELYVYALGHIEGAEAGWCVCVGRILSS